MGAGVWKADLGMWGPLPSIVTMAEWDDSEQDTGQASGKGDLKESFFFFFFFYCEDFIIRLYTKSVTNFCSLP